MSGEPLAVQVREVLKAKAKVPVKAGVVLLKEKQGKKTIMQVTLLDVPEGVTVINLEKIGELSGVHGKFTSKCDYLVLFPEGEAEAAVFVELKKTLEEGSRGLEQLRRSPRYLAYLKTICSIHFDGDAERTRRVAIRYLLVGERTTELIAKQNVSDPQALPVAEHKGIIVQRFVGDKLRFDRLRGLAA